MDMRVVTTFLYMSSSGSTKKEWDPHSSKSIAGEEAIM